MIRTPEWKEDGDDQSYAIHVRTEVPLWSNGEPDNEIWKYHGDITTVYGQKEVGVITAMRFRPNAGDVLDAADALSGPASELAITFFNQDGYRPEIEEQFDDCTMGGGDLLSIEHVEIKPSFRGKKIGLAAVWYFLERFRDGCGLAVCRPFPLQFNDGGVKDSLSLKLLAKYRAQGLEMDREKAFAKLTAYWGRLGFKQVKDTPFMALELDLKQPGPPWPVKGNKRPVR